MIFSSFNTRPTIPRSITWDTDIIKWTILTPWSRVLLETPTQELCNSFETRLFIPVVTSARYWPLSWARWLQSIPPHPISQRSILILSSHPRLGFFPSGFPTKIMYAVLFSHTRATSPANLTLLDLIIRIIFNEESKIWSSLLWSFLHPPVISCVFGQNEGKIVPVFN
jgi:hypothetical protein